VPNISEVPSGVLIIEFVRWLCGPWVAFGHWRTDLIFEWYLVRCGFKNISQEDICLKKVRLHVQNIYIITILSSVVNITGGGT
jgi:hypothetical protein